MTVKYSYTMGVDAIPAACKSIKTRTTKMRDDIHKVAVSVLHNWASSGAANVARDQANLLLDAIDENYRQACVNWFGMHAGFVFDTKEGTFSYSADKTTITTAEYQEAKAESMFDLTPAKKVQPYDLRAKVLALVASAESRRKKGVDEKDNVPAELIAGLKALVADDAS